MSREEKRGGAWSAIILAGLVVVVAIYTAGYGLSTLVWAQAKMAASANPWLKDVPQALAAQPAPPPPPPQSGKKQAAQAKDQTVEAYGYELTVPWPGKHQISAKQNGTEFHFDSGQVIFFFDPGSELDTVKALEAATSPQAGEVQTIFGGHIADTNYDLYREVYAASPSQISPFMNSRDAMRLAAFLNWKLSFGRDAWPGMSSFSLGSLRGFEFGDVSKGRPVAVRAFDDHDRQIRMIFTVAAGSGAKLSQDDITAILASIRLEPLAGD